MGQYRPGETGFVSASKAFGCLWFAGIKDATCIHRCVPFFVHEKNILVKTGKCFALNGLVFLGSILLWDNALSPGIRRLLHLSLADRASESYVSILHSALCSIFGVIWLVPVYMVSFPLSCIWYQEIAQLALQVSQNRRALGKQKQQDAKVQLAQELYRAILFAVFFMQTFVVSLIPYVGVLANFLLLSWLNALYSFDYKWSLTKRTLQERIHFFELHWAFFAGFGSCLTLATMWCSFFSGAAILAMVYPLFILVACDSDPLLHHQRAAESEKAAGRELPAVRLPIFLPATQATSWLIAHSSELMGLPEALWQRRWQAGGGLLLMSCLVVGVSFL